MEEAHSSPLQSVTVVAAHELLIVVWYPQEHSRRQHNQFHRLRLLPEPQPQKIQPRQLCLLAQQQLLPVPLVQHHQLKLQQFYLQQQLLHLQEPHLQMQQSLLQIQQALLQQAPQLQLLRQTVQHLLRLNSHQLIQPFPFRQSELPVLPLALQPENQLPQHRFHSEPELLLGQ